MIPLPQCCDLLIRLEQNRLLMALVLLIIFLFLGVWIIALWFPSLSESQRKGKRDDSAVAWIKAGQFIIVLAIALFVFHIYLLVPIMAVMACYLIWMVCQSLLYAWRK